METPFTLKDFNIDSTHREWIQNPTKTLLLVGRSGVGKTQFFKAVAKEKFSKTLVVNHKEDLRRVDDTFDSIIIDDANIDQLEDTQLLSLIDHIVGKTLRVLYDTVYKKKGVVQMIAMNRKEFIKIYGRLKEERMLRKDHVKKTFLMYVNLHIQNIQKNHITHNYNIKKSIIDVKRIQESQQKHIQQTGRLIDDYYYNEKEETERREY